MAKQSGQANYKLEINIPINSTIAHCRSQKRLIIANLMLQSESQLLIAEAKRNL